MCQGCVCVCAAVHLGVVMVLVVQGCGQGMSEASATHRVLRRHLVSACECCTHQVFRPSLSLAQADIQPVT